VATKCNVVNWDDQLSLFELAFEKYGSVDIVVCIISFSLFRPRVDDDRYQTLESPKTHVVYVLGT